MVKNKKKNKKVKKIKNDLEFHLGIMQQNLDESSKLIKTKQKFSNLLKKLDSDKEESNDCFLIDKNKINLNNLFSFKLNEKLNNEFQKRFVNIFCEYNSITYL